MTAEQQTEDCENPKMGDVHIIGKPKVSKRRGWALFLLINALLLAGCLWTVGNYNDWHGYEYLPIWDVTTVDVNVLVRLVFCLVLVTSFGLIFVTLDRRISWLRWIVGLLMVLGLIDGLSNGTSYMFAVSVCLTVAFLLATAASIYLPATRRWSFALAMVAFIGGANLANYVSLPRHQKLLEGRSAFPFEDISSRLAYELWGSADSDEFPTSRDVHVLKQINAMTAPTPGDSRAERNAERRNNWLLEFHDKQFEEFIRAEGFGVSRMIFPGPNRAKLPRIRDFPVDERFIEPTSGNMWRQFAADREETFPLENESIESFHERSLEDFLNPVAFGFVHSRQIVAGFQPHAFHIPVVPENRSVDLPKLEELQLVSLLRFGNPEVYYLDNLPRMDQLSSGDYETRALDNFETMALKRLYYPEEIVVVEENSTIRMLGAIRASYTCLQCHTVEDGSLLGAFSYRFSIPQDR